MHRFAINENGAVFLHYTVELGLGEHMLQGRKQHSKTLIAKDFSDRRQYIPSVEIAEQCLEPDEDWDWEYIKNMMPDIYNPTSGLPRPESWQERTLRSLSRKGSEDL